MSVRFLRHPGTFESVEALVLFSYYITNVYWRLSNVTFCLQSCVAVEMCALNKAAENISILEIGDQAAGDSKYFKSSTNLRKLLCHLGI